MQKQRGPASPSQGGQILLIVVLVIIVASTIGLSIATRSIISLRTSTEEAESQKALAAAEAGIERAIQNSIPIGIGGDNPSNNSRYTTKVEEVKDSSFLINGGNVIPKDEGADVWLVGHNSDGSLDYSSVNKKTDFINLYWGSSSEACGTSTAPAATQVIVVSRDKTTEEIKSYRYAYDSCSRGNNFTKPSEGSFSISGKTFTNKTPEGPSDSDIGKGVKYIVFIRVIPIYKDAVIAVSACNNGGNNCTGLPTQGYKISSTGTSGSANRMLTVFKGYPQTYLPYLSYGLFVAN